MPQHFLLAGTGGVCKVFAHKSIVAWEPLSQIFAHASGDDFPYILSLLGSFSVRGGTPAASGGTPQLPEGSQVRFLKDFGLSPGLFGEAFGEHFGHFGALLCNFFASVFFYTSRVAP